MLLKFGPSINGRNTLTMRLCLFFCGAVCLLGVPARGAQDCNKHRECSFGSIRQLVLNHHGVDKSHPLMRALRTYLPHKDCPDKEIEDKQKAVFSETELSHDFAPQCISPGELAAPVKNSLISAIRPIAGTSLDFNIFRSFRSPFAGFASTWKCLNLYKFVSLS